MVLTRFLLSVMGSCYELYGNGGQGLFLFLFLLYSMEGELEVVRSRTNVDTILQVREATNNEPWGASSTLMQEIANGTHN